MSEDVLEVRKSTTDWNAHSSLLELQTLKLSLARLLALSRSLSLSRLHVRAKKRICESLDSKRKKSEEENSLVLIQEKWKSEVKKSKVRRMQSKGAYQGNQNNGGPSTSAGATARRPRHQGSAGVLPLTPPNAPDVRGRHRRRAELQRLTQEIRMLQVNWYLCSLSYLMAWRKQ